MASVHGCLNYVPGNLLQVPTPPLTITYIATSTRQISPSDPDLLPPVLELYPLNAREMHVKKKKGGSKSGDKQPEDAETGANAGVTIVGARKKRRRGTNGDKVSAS